MLRDDALNPDLAKLLRLFNLDLTWAKGSGVWLYDDENHKYLDFYSQYGAVPLGHNAGAVVKAVEKELKAERPALVQPYRAPNAVELAEQLVRITPERLRHCTFTTSGAETVEAAIKLVRAKTGRTWILSCDGAYHGKTMGAMAASSTAAKQDLFGPRPQGFASVPFGDAAAVENFLKRNAQEVAGVLLEPIQGEGGVIIPDDEYLPTVRSICDHYGVAMILDEIQTGLGRTGQLFACQIQDVSPDVLLLSKALGGGLFPLGACLTSKEYWDEGFAFAHSSTFANNNIACRAGLAVLEEICPPRFCERVRENGALLREGLLSLAERHPKTVADIRSVGLMAALELRPPNNDAGTLFNYAYHHGLYAFAFAALMARQHSVLVLPTLGNSNVVRLSPPLVVGPLHIQKALAGLDAVLSLFSGHDSAALARTIGQLDRWEDYCSFRKASYRSPALPKINKAPAKTEASFAFIAHCTTREDIVTNDPQLRGLSGAEFDSYCKFLGRLPPGVVLTVPTIRSHSGAEASGWVISMGLLPEEMAARGRVSVSREISKAVDLACDLGAKVVGLGAFTKIFSRHGLDVIERGPAITTGNALTAEMAIRAVVKVLERRGGSLDEASVAVVGARGSVGGICAKLIARTNPRSVLLVGNPNDGVNALQKLRAETANLCSSPVLLSTCLSDLSRCDVVLSATSSPFPLLDDVSFKAGTIICDLARPPDTSAKLRERADVSVIDGGLVAFPDKSFRLGIGNLQGYRPGTQLACFAETALLALAGCNTNICVGKNARMVDVDFVRQLADVHGFDVAEPEFDALDFSVHSATGRPRTNALRLGA